MALIRQILPKVQIEPGVGAFHRGMRTPAALLAAAAALAPLTARGDDASVPAAEPATADAAPAVPAPPPEPDVVTPDGGVTRVEGLAYDSVAGYASGSARANASNWMILPRGWEATGELRLLTSDAAMGDPMNGPMRLTDVAITRASMRRSIHGKVEVSGSVDVLPKQTSLTDELVWQQADLGARFAVGQRHAVWTGVGGGPLTADQGWWMSVSSGIQRRAIVHETLSFQMAAGGSFTPLLQDGDAGTAWLGEVVVRGQTLFKAPNGMFGQWLGADFAFPVASGGSLGGGAFDPPSRVDVAIGTVYAVVDDWDVYAELTVTDRGDAGLPATQLPILQGGSDQRALVVGITHHFGQDEDAYDPDIKLAY